MSDSSLRRVDFVLRPLACALAAFSGTAWSQDGAPAVAPSAAAASAAAPASAASASDIEKQTVYVTANRRREKARDVAGSVNVLGGGQLEQLGVSSIDEIAGYVPSLQVTGDSPGTQRVVIRGITTGSQQAGATVATYLDDQPISLSNSIVGGAVITNDIDPLDLERIEVLKGPQGSLYGASALGGVVKYVTVAPNLKEVEGRAEVGWTQGRGDGGLTARAALNVPVSKDLFAVRVTAYTRKEPGYVTDTLRGRTDLDSFKNEGGRLAALLKPSARFDAKLTLDTQTLKSDDAAVPQADAATLQPSYGRYDARRQFAQPIKGDYNRGALTLNYDFGFANLLSVSSYAHIKNSQVQDDSDYAKFLDFLSVVGFSQVGFNVASLNPSAARLAAVVDTRKKVQEFRLTSPVGTTFDWLGGLFFQNEDVKATSALDFFSGTDLQTPSARFLDADLGSTLRESAAYLNGTYHVSSSFDVQTGVRYTRLRQDYDISTQTYNYVAGALLPGAANTATSRENQTTWLVSPRWALSADDMVYFRAASGYRPGGPNVPDSTGHLRAPFKSDSIINYEVGYKGLLPAAHLDLSAALFLIDWKDIQVTATDATTGNQYYTNGGTARSKGFELEAGWRPVEGLRTSATLSLINARLTEDIPAVSGLSGDRIPFTPAVSGSLGADYSWVVGPGQLSLGASVQHTGKRTVVFSNQLPTPLVPTNKAPELPAYQLLNLRASYAFDRWTANLFVKNALDRRSPITYNGENVVPNLATGAATPADVGVTAPRTIGVSLRVDY